VQEVCDVSYAHISCQEEFRVTKRTMYTNNNWQGPFLIVLGKCVYVKDIVFMRTIDAVSK